MDILVEAERPLRAPKPGIAVARGNLIARLGNLASGKAKRLEIPVED
jgi:hypothetical protein